MSQDIRFATFLGESTSKHMIWLDSCCYTALKSLAVVDSAIGIYLLRGRDRVQLSTARMIGGFRKLTHEES